MKYWTLHRWVRKFKIKPDFCVSCNSVPPVDVANISGKYKEDLNDFEWLCRKCHMKKDGRIISLKSMASHPGEKSGVARLNESQILKIKALRLDGFSYPKISKIAGISTSYAHRICTGLAWKHLNGKRKP